MASFSYVDIGTLTQETATTSHVVPTPAAVQDGDLMIALLCLDVSPNDTTVPSGWSTRYNVELGGQMLECTKMAQSEPADYTFTTGTSTASVCAIVAYRGGDTVNTLNADAQTTSGVSPATWPDITTTKNGCMIVLIVAADSPNAGGAGTYSAPAGGYNERCNLQNTSQRNNLAIFDLVQASQGTISGLQTTYGGGSVSPSQWLVAQALGPSTPTPVAWIDA